MVFFTLVLRPAMCRWTNIALAILYSASIVPSAIGESAHFIFLSAAEVALLLLIVRRVEVAATGGSEPELGSSP
jgi:hypothetical protein